MKKFWLAALAASTVTIAAPASAQVAGTASGTVTINGTVSGKCSVVNATNVAQPDYTATVDLGELAQADGRLVTSASLATTFGSKAFRVICTTATPGVKVEAAPVIISGGGTAPSGYANTVNYKAHATFALTPSGSQTVTDDSGGAATEDTLTGRLAGSGDNVTITADTFATPNSTDVLMAGTYQGSVVVTVTPS